jgi:hypothetical protein
MDSNDHRIPIGPFKGKRIEFAPVTRVEMFTDIAEDFMTRIFNFDPGEYLLSDESSLGDFIASSKNRQFMKGSLSCQCHFKQIDPFT